MTTDSMSTEGGTVGSATKAARVAHSYALGCCLCVLEPAEHGFTLCFEVHLDPRGVGGPEAALRAVVFHASMQWHQTCVVFPILPACRLKGSYGRFIDQPSAEVGGSLGSGRHI